MDTLLLCLLTAIPLLLLLLHFRYSRCHTFWQRKCIPCAKDIRPIIGNAPILPFFRNMGNLCTKIYRDHPEKSMVGFYDYSDPCLLIRDPELIKSVLITNFSRFSDNDMMVQEHEEPLLAKNPFFTSGDAWKVGRAKLTSSLTANKLKMYSLGVREVTKKLIQYVDEKIQRNQGCFEVEVKDLLSKVTAEVTANVGFGVEGYSFDDDSNESFQACGKLFFGSDWVSIIKNMIVLQFPWILGLLKISFVPEKFEQLFRKLVKRAMDERKKGSSFTHYVDVMIDVEEKEGGERLKNEEVTAHMLSFFLDTFETSSAAMTFVCYNLAVHKEVQEEARKKVFEVTKRCGGLSYEAAGELVYLEQVTFESLRLFPVFNAQVKRCTQHMLLVGADGLKCMVDAGSRIFIPTEGLHRDPSIWDEPKEFRPERFEKEKVGERNKLVFLPFGEGPRMCPGRKFALMMIKMTIAVMLMEYEFELSKRTKLPIEMDPFIPFSYAKGGMWIKFRKL